MALGLGNTAQGSAATPGATATASIINNASGVDVMFVAYYSNGAFASTTSITDPSGVTWSLRKRIRFLSPWLGAGSTANANYIVHEIWWANDVTSTNRSITFNIANNASCVRMEWMFLCMTGSLTPTAPWDTHASLPTAAQTFGQPVTTTGAISLGVTTAQANSQVLSFLSEVMSTTASTASSTGTGFSAVDNQTDGTTPNQFHLFLQNKAQAVAGAVTASATNPKQSFVFTADAISGTSTGSAASGGTIDLASVQNLSSGNANAGTGTSVTFTYTNTAPCVLIANITTLGGTGGFVPISGVTDSAGITWHRRNSVAFNSTNFSGLSGGINHITHEVWWANVTAAHGSNVTVTIAKTGTANEGSNTLISWATFTGAQDPSKPWDANGGLGADATYTNASVATAPAKSWVVTASQEIVLGFLHQMGATGNVNVSTAPTGFTLGSAHITIGNSTTGPLQNAIAWSTSGQSGSGTETWNGSSTLEWVLFTDALASDGTGTSSDASITSASGTIAQALTKISQSAAGTEKFTGTISMALTKASIAGIAKEIFTGTISTALTKASMSAAGGQSFVVNSIATNLTKISQSGTAAEIFTGTISTLLSGISQEADGTVSSPAVSITGTVETDLSRVAQALLGKEIFSASISTTLSGIAQTLSGQEVFSGSITTTLSGISQEVDGHVSPLMIGTIATHLESIGHIAQGLVAEEDIIGHIVTVLGATGQLISTDVEGLLIIEGPIVTDLSGFGQAILGGSLGTPGSGKWYSYRYLDS